MVATPAATAADMEDMVAAAMEVDTEDMAAVATAVTAVATTGPATVVVMEDTVADIKVDMEATVDTGKITPHASFFNLCR
jgi:hypothetical protein